MYSLSKSTYIRSLQCKKSLWLYKNHPKLRDIITPEQQAIFNRGHQIGELAQQLFPNGVDVGWDKPWNFQPSLDATQQHIADGTPAIFEASFLADETIIAIDVLARNDDGKWIAYEVKSSLFISETFLRDAALQNYIIEKSGLEIVDFCIIHLNKDYVKKDDEINVNELFSITSVKEQVQKRKAFTMENLREAKNIITDKNMPDVKIGLHCDEPYPCDFKGHCFSEYGNESIFQLTSIPEDTKWDLFERNKIQLKDLTHKEVDLDTTFREMVVIMRKTKYIDTTSHL
jgi:hypothetical protein